MPSSTYHPHAKQAILHNLGTRFVAAVAGRRGGKTKAGAAEFTARMVGRLATAPVPTWSRQRLVRPSVHGWIVAPTYELLAEPFRCLYDALPPELIADWRGDVKPPMARLHGGILIQGRSADHPDSLVSVGLDVLWVDETAAVSPSVWQASLRPTLTDRRGGGIFTTTPRGHNWFYKEIWQRVLAKQAGWGGVHWKTSENTAAPEVVADVERARRDMPEVWFRREYEASFEAMQGVIYADYSEDAHVFDGPIDPRRYSRVILGVDWGYSTPGAIVCAGLGPEQTIDVIAEVVGAGHLPEWWHAQAAALRTDHGARFAYCDPSQPDRIRMLSRVLPAGAADNDVHAGISAVATTLHQRVRLHGQDRPRLRVHASCANLRATMGVYRWHEHRGQPTEEPAPGQDDHALDSLRYLTLGASQGPSLWVL